MGRLYLDWNATAPLRPEARAAMVEAMDLAGNASSVHAEGRRARGLIERARAQVAAAIGAEVDGVVFTSGATEAAAAALAGRDLVCAGIEHDAVRRWCREGLAVSGGGQVAPDDPAGAALQLANSETGVVQVLPRGLAVSDVTQGFGKLPFAFGWSGVEMAICSGHKLGGPAGIGALIVGPGLEPAVRLKGGGQELGRRAGTENIVGIAGFGAAAAAAARDLADGVWDAVAARRDMLEEAMAAASPETLFVGAGGPRLPNTCLAVTPGWKGAAQVMAMDLAGFAVSAGSACSSGKIRHSGVLTAMGLDAADADAALRISIGPDVTGDEMLRFAEAWGRAARKQRARAA